MLPKKTNSYIFSLIVGALFVIPVTRGESSGQPMTEDEELKLDIAQIEALGRLNNIRDMETFADNMELTWRQRNKNSYAKIMLKICDALSINVIDTRKQDQLIEQYATRALEQAKWDKSDDFPLEQGFELLVHLFYKDGAIDSRGDAKACDWQKKRSAEAKLWASFWQKLERSIDADWNVRDRPMLSVPPPNGSKDPNVLAEYNAEVEKNAGKTRKYNQQYKLRKLQKQFLPKAEKYFIRAYSLPPSNIDELRQYLADIADTSSKERILTTVTGVRSAGP